MHGVQGLLVPTILFKGSYVQYIPKCLCSIADCCFPGFVLVPLAPCLFPFNVQHSCICAHAYYTLLASVPGLPPSVCVLTSFSLPSPLPPLSPPSSLPSPLPLPPLPPSPPSLPFPSLLSPLLPLFPLSLSRFRSHRGLTTPTIRNYLISFHSSRLWTRWTMFSLSSGAVSSTVPLPPPHRTIACKSHSMKSYRGTFSLFSC